MQISRGHKQSSSKNTYILGLAAVICEHSEFARIIYQKLVRHKKVLKGPS